VANRSSTIGVLMTKTAGSLPNDDPARAIGRMMQLIVDAFGWDCSVYAENDPNKG